MTLNVAFLPGQGYVSAPPTVEQYQRAVRWLEIRGRNSEARSLLSILRRLTWVPKRADQDGLSKGPCQIGAYADGRSASRPVSLSGAAGTEHSHFPRDAAVPAVSVELSERPLLAGPRDTTLTTERTLEESGQRGAPRVSRAPSHSPQVRATAAADSSPAAAPYSGGDA